MSGSGQRGAANDDSVDFAPGVEGRLYSGASGSLRSSTRNRVPVTLLDLSLATGATFVQDLPAAYNAFLYVLEGSVIVAGNRVAEGQVGWLTPSAADQLAIATLRAGPPA
jgi:redox-sensitive bicupin YhaK (pirin superfamily)